MSLGVRWELTLHLQNGGVLRPWRLPCQHCPQRAEGVVAGLRWSEFCKRDSWRVWDETPPSHSSLTFSASLPPSKPLVSPFLLWQAISVFKSNLPRRTQHSQSFTPFLPLGTFLQGGWVAEWDNSLLMPKETVGPLGTITWTVIVILEVRMQPSLLESPCWWGGKRSLLLLVMEAVDTRGVMWRASHKPCVISLWPLRFVKCSKPGNCKELAAPLFGKN